MSWDPVQREMLEALGHVVYRTAPVGAAPIPDDALLHALLRAADRDVNSSDAAALCQAWMPSVSVRDAAAKRALWPSIRALRAPRG